MEKTIIINIGNTIIHIEESAYELLKIYLTAIKNHFSNHADDLEIVTDIENRIAELLSEQLQEQKKQVVDIATANTVVAQMGRVTDFETIEEDEDPKVTDREELHYTNKKLYRDMDNRVVAGVCSGIAHYINTETRWVRVALVLTAFVGGFGLMVYIVLWMIMPKAISRTEKMEMKGEPANLQGFQRNLDEELLALKESIKVVNHHAQPLLARFGNFIGEFFEWLGRFINGTGKVIFKIIAGLIIVFGALFLLSLIISLGAILGFYDDTVYNTMPFVVINQEYRLPVLIAGFVVLFVPILALVLFSIRVAFNKQAINKTLSFSLLIIWLTGAGFAGYYASKTLTEFKQQAELTQNLDLKSYSTYTLDVDKSKFFSKEDSINYHIDGNVKNRIIVDNLNDEGPFADEFRVRINIEKSTDGKTSLMQTHSAQGKTFKVALQNAQNISYKFGVKDSVLTLNPRFQIGKESNWRDQTVKLTFYVPVGTKLLLKQDINRYIQNYYLYDDHSNHYGENKGYDIFVMTDNGLQCQYDLDHSKKEKDEE